MGKSEIAFCKCCLDRQAQPHSQYNPPDSSDSRSNGDGENHLCKGGLKRICHHDTVTPIPHFVVNKTSPATSLAQGPDLFQAKLEGPQEKLPFMSASGGQDTRVPCSKIDMSQKSFWLTFWAHLAYFLRIWCIKKINSFTWYFFPQRYSMDMREENSGKKEMLRYLKHQTLDFSPLNSV